MEAIDPAAILLQEDDRPQAVAESIRPIEELAAFPQPQPATPRKKSTTINLSQLPPLTTNDPPLWRRHLHWLLALALIPLVVSLLTKAEEASLLERLRETLDQATPVERDRIIHGLEHAKSLDDILQALPDQRLPGALLSRSSLAHLMMAAVAILFYMAFFMFLAADGSAKPLHVLAVGLFTATIGVAFLLLVQLLASFTEGRVLVGFNIVALIFLVLKFVAFSYGAAMNPENGFFLSLVGFTLGVGLCEELVKVIPLFWHRSADAGRNWRGMLIWGLASGAGFGIAEAIMYSNRYYNGVSGLGIYLVRFISCVALHAIWSGSVAILLFIRRDLFAELDRWFEWVLPTLFVIAVPAVLHGLYDTCLKKDQSAFALVVAFASFGYLAFLFSRLQTGDDEQANKAMLKEYQRRKAALA